jgi:hypothetical protein
MLRNTILRDIRKIDNPAVLNQLFEYLQLLKKNVNTQRGNTAAVLSFAGTIGNVEAKAVKQVVENEFNTIEGEW